MPYYRPWTIVIALIFAATGVLHAQMMPGMGGGQRGGAQMPGMGGAGEMGGMPGGGMQQQPQAPKWISPLVPLCWSVGHSRYPGIACLYVTRGQKKQLRSLMRQVDDQIEGRFWVKFVNVSADTTPPSYIREILAPEFRRAGGGGTATTGAGVGEGTGQQMMGGAGMGAGGGMTQQGATGGAQTQGNKEVWLAAQKACPAIVIFGKDLFSTGQPQGGQGGAASTAGQSAQGAPAPATAGGGPMEAAGQMLRGFGMGGMTGGMTGGAEAGGAAGGMGAAGTAQSKWSQMDRKFMVYWSFVGQSEIPQPQILRPILEAIGDPEDGININALRLKLNRQDAQRTFTLGKAYTHLLVRGRQLLDDVNADTNPANARIVQQNQYLADYFLARAETLEFPTQQVVQQQIRLAPSIRYAPPTDLIPLLAKRLPGLVGYYMASAQRNAITLRLDKKGVTDAMSDTGYWVKFVQATEKPPEKPRSGLDLRKALQDLQLQKTQLPALMLYAPDPMARQVVMVAGGGAAQGGAGGPGMGGLTTEGMAGTGTAPAGGMTAGGGAAAAPEAKPTDWLPSGGAAATGAGGGGAGIGAEAGAAAPQGTGMGTDMGTTMAGGGMGGMAGGTGGVQLSPPSWSNYDYRMPPRIGNLRCLRAYTETTGLPHTWGQMPGQQTTGYAAFKITLKKVADAARLSETVHDQQQRFLEAQQSVIAETAGTGGTGTPGGAGGMGPTAMMGGVGPQGMGESGGTGTAAPQTSKRYGQYFDDPANVPDAILQEMTAVSRARPNGRPVLDLARTYTDIPTHAMADYMLARTDYLITQGWVPKADHITQITEKISDLQAKSPDYTGGDYLLEIANCLNYVRQQHQLQEAVDSSVQSLMSRVLLAAVSILHREGSLPVFHEDQYLATISGSASPMVPLSDSSQIATPSELDGSLSSYYQKPPRFLTDRQLRRLRGQLMSMARRFRTGIRAKIAWSRLLPVEMEIRNRRGTTGADSHWSRIASLWQQRQPFGSSDNNYANELLSAAIAGAREEIEALRAVNIAGVQIDNSRRETTTVQGHVGADVISQLESYLGRRPHGRLAPQSRYMLGRILVGAGKAPDGNEQFAAVKLETTDRLPRWWRWGSHQWNDFISRRAQMQR